MDDKNFKRKYKFPACTKDPLAFLIPKGKRHETLREIRQDCLDKLGETLDQCPLRKVCMGRECLGRPLPVCSPAAKPYIEKLSEIADVRGGKLYIETSCNGCPIKASCSNPCLQITDYTDRGASKEPYLIHSTNLVEALELKQEAELESYRGREINFLSVPWDCLPKKRAEVITKYLYENKDFKRVAEELGFNNEARAKYEFYSGLNTLSEFANMREFLEEKGDSLTGKQYNILKALYLEAKPVKEVCQEFNLTKQSISNLVKRVVDKYNIKWQRFVYKKGNRVIYDTPEILK